MEWSLRFKSDRIITSCENSSWWHFVKKILLRTSHPGIDEIVLKKSVSENWIFRKSVAQQIMSSKRMVAKTTRVVCAQKKVKSSRAEYLLQPVKRTSACVISCDLSLLFFRSSWTWDTDGRWPMDTATGCSIEKKSETIIALHCNFFAAEKKKKNRRSRSKLLQLIVGALKLEWRDNLDSCNGLAKDALGVKQMNWQFGGL